MTKEALKMALEALETNNKAWKHLADSGDAGFWEAEEQPFYELSVKAITAIKEALAQPEEKYQYGTPLLDSMTKDYIPPQRTWVGLTDEEMGAIYEQHHNQYGECESANLGYERAIEAKLRSKND